jgi:hypothetical protein
MTLTSEEWELVELDGGGPVIEPITLSHLHTEWRATKIELSSAHQPGPGSAWSKVLRLYLVLRTKGKLQAEGIINVLFSDLAEMMVDPTYSRVHHFLFSVYYDLYRVENIPLIGYAAQFVLPPLIALPEIVSKIDPDSLDPFVEQFSADLVIDSSHRSPFLDFLVRSYTYTANSVGQKCRTLILQILNDPGPRESALRLKGMLIESFIKLFVFIAKISPTVHSNSQLLEIFKFANRVLMFIREPELIEKFTTEISQKVIAMLRNFSDHLQLISFTLFLANVTMPATLSLFIESIVDINGVFRLKFERWRENWALDTLKLISAMLETRSSAIRSAFFFSTAPDSVNSSPVYCFVSDPIPRPGRKVVTELLFDRQTIDRYRIEISELPGRRPQIVSLLDFLLHMFEKLWALPMETAPVLLSTIVKVAALGTRSVYDFCFTQGGKLFSVAGRLMLERDGHSQDVRDLLASFVLTMKQIIEWHPMPRN